MRAEMPNRRMLEDCSSDIRGLAATGVVKATSQINDNYFRDHTEVTESGLQVFVVVLVKDTSAGFPALPFYRLYIRILVYFIKVA